MEIGSFPPMSTRPKKGVLVSGRSPTCSAAKKSSEGDDLVQVLVLRSLSMAPSFACWSTSAAAVLGLGNF